MKRYLHFIIISMLILASLCTGCGAGIGETEASLGDATEVGVPDGSATMKNIGSAGGSVESTDGRMIVTVPPGAVTAPTEFKIQPITNQSQGGRGNAYRLEPNGQKFATPVQVSFKYADQDIENTVPEAFSVAYQDQSGVWQAFTTAKIDQASKTVTVSATHFTDFSLWTFALSPAKATLRVGETQAIALVGCYRANSLTNTLRRLVGIGPLVCATENTRDSSSWTANYGTIVPTGDSRNSVALYTAPAKKPRPNVDTVRFVYTLRFADGITDVRTAEITIVDRGYRATGQTADLKYFGVICDLEKPFTVYGSVISYKFNFTPTSATGGTATISAAGMMVMAEGRGNL